MRYNLIKEIKLGDLIKREYLQYMLLLSNLIFNGSYVSYNWFNSTL